MKKNVYSVPVTLGTALLILLLSALIAHIPAGAQSTALSTDPSKELDDRVRLFFNDLLADDASKAFSDLLRSSATSEPVAGMKSKLEDVKDQFGPLRKYERVNVKSIGEDLVVVRYLLKCERHPVLWTFTFYRRPTETSSLTASSWSVIGLRFDSNLDPLL